MFLQADRRRCHSADLQILTPEEDDRGSSAVHRDSHVVHILHLLHLLHLLLHLILDMKASRSREPSDGGPPDQTPADPEEEEEEEDFCPGYKDVDAFTKVGTRGRSGTQGGDQ